MFDVYNPEEPLSALEHSAVVIEACNVLSAAAAWRREQDK